MTGPAACSKRRGLQAGAAWRLSGAWDVLCYPSILGSACTACNQLPAISCFRPAACNQLPAAGCVSGCLPPLTRRVLDVLRRQRQASDHLGEGRGGARAAGCVRKARSERSADTATARLALLRLRCMQVRLASTKSAARRSAAASWRLLLDLLAPRLLSSAPPGGGLTASTSSGVRSTLRAVYLLLRR